jgi:hypothetical protein
MGIDMIGTFLPKDSYFRDVIWETAVGCSTRNVIMNAAILLINAIDDELASELIPKARKKRCSILRVELEQKILCVSGQRGHLAPFAPPELRELQSAQILPFKKHPTHTPETL